MEKDTYPSIDISSFEAASKTNQIILVIPETTTSHQAKFYYYIKNENTNQWEEYLSTDCNIGKAGIGKEKEGDMKTPTGVYQLGICFGINKNPGTKIPYIKLNASLFWDGDNESRKYNQLVNNETYTDFDPEKSEHLIDYNPGYEYGININYNKECIPNKGSGIFLHCYTKKDYTAGCVAIKRELLAEVLKKVNDNCYIIIDVFENMKNYSNKAEFRTLGILVVLLNFLLL